MTNRSRRIGFLAWTAALPIWLATSQSRGAQGLAPGRPDILLIVSEDTSPNLGCYGDHTVPTPNLDRLAAEGVRFDRAYVTTASCSESRSSILTGLYPHQNGQIGLATHRFSMYRDWPNIPSLLKQAGYRTGILGKLHVNPESAFPFDLQLIVSLLPDRPDPSADCYQSPKTSWSNIQAEDVAAAPAEIRRAFAVWARPPAERLFDLQKDPYELNNLAGRAEHAEAQSRLRWQLRRWREETRDPLLDPQRLARLTEEVDAVAQDYAAGREKSSWRYSAYLDLWTTDTAATFARGKRAPAAEGSLYVGGPEAKITLVAPEQPDPLEEFAIAELAKHVERVTGQAPRTLRGGDVKAGDRIIIGRPENNQSLGRLAREGFLKIHRAEQGYAMRIDRDPHDRRGGSWLAALCGADPHGVLYAARDFSHYYFYKDDSGVVLRPARVQLAPRLKLRGLSESGCNLFSAKNNHDGFMHTANLNYFSEDAVFDKQYYVDWLSEWKINFVSLLWTNYPAYDEARRDLVEYAHARGIKVLGFFVPYRPSHEKPPASISKADPMKEDGDCPRDPQVRKWYFERLAELVTREPKIDMIQIESPHHDGVYCHCPVCQGTKNPYPEDKLLAEMVEVVRNRRPEIPVVRAVKRPVPDDATARRLAEQLKTLEGPNDWHMNTYPNDEHRRRWHDLGPKFATYLRPFREVLKGADPARDIRLLFDHFRTSAERDVVAHQFCHRFYGGRFGSFPVEQDRQMLERYPDRKGPFSLALLAETAFDPFVDGPARAQKIRRIYAITIPDYPAGRPLTDEDFEAIQQRDR